ncbi:MAG: endolytic transglycosylase MltG [Anaerolineales bacterium]|nr:endolytic transglycosylase MltG [Chloroflexota bacterium]MBL6981788.1 endolytic transglycosylase MltG [Anaerolineales bacterium]
MKKSQSKYCAILLLPLLVALGLLFFYLVIFPVTMPKQINATFGSPAPNLGLVERTSLTLQLYRYSDQLTEPANPFGDISSFQIILGESPIVVSQRLEEQGLIQNADAFRVYLIYSGMDTQIQAGEYTLSPALNSLEIAQALLDPNPTNAMLVVLAGWRLEEVGIAVPTSGLSITREVFVDLAEAESAEGYLLPGTYDLPRTTDAAALLATLRATFEQAITDEMRGGFEQQGLSLHEAVILASIVEREAVVDEEMPIIASVFFNRLVIGMKLETDPTVQYAIGFNHAQGRWWTNPLSLQDLQINSPYNTYIYAGLPPGPICSPGINALRAVAFPAQTPYYYFRATCDGSGRHFFAETFAEHQSNACP